MASAISGAKIVLENDLCQVMKNGRIVLSAKKWGRIYGIMAALVMELKGEGNVLVNYHCRCRHTNYRTIRLMCKTGILPLIKEQGDHSDNICQTYLKDKMSRTVISKLFNTRTREPGELVHIDLCRPIITRSI